MQEDSKKKSGFYKKIRFSCADSASFCVLPQDAEKPGRSRVFPVDAKSELVFDQLVVVYAAVQRFAIVCDDYDVVSIAIAVGVGVDCAVIILVFPIDVDVSLDVLTVNSLESVGILLSVGVNSLEGVAVRTEVCNSCLGDGAPTDHIGTVIALVTNLGNCSIFNVESDGRNFFVNDFLSFGDVLRKNSYFDNLGACVVVNDPVLVFTA